MVEVLLCALLIVILLVANLLQYRKANQHDGQVVITRDEETGKMIISLELDKDPAEIENMNTISFKVTERESPGYDNVAN
jgi:hypothetical protein